MATAQVNNVENIGGAVDGSAFPSVTVPQGSSLVYLFGGSSGALTINIFQNSSTTQGAYITPSGKIFHCIGMWVRNSSSGGTMAICLAQSTSAPSQGGSVGSPPSGSIYYNAAAAIATAANIKTSGLFIPASSGVTVKEIWVPLPGVSFGTVGTQYYPYFVDDGDSGSAFGIRMVGYLDTNP